MTASDLMSEPPEGTGSPDAAADARVVTYRDAYRAAFERLNLEWIERYFVVEERDRRTLGNPREEIIERGGEIFFLLEDGRPVGTVAMVPISGEVYELTKMAVTPTAQGRGYGKRLLVHAVEWARERGGRRVVLQSQTSLGTAIALYRRAGFKTTRLGPSAAYARADIEMSLDLAPGGAE